MTLKEISWKSFQHAPTTSDGSDIFVSPEKVVIETVLARNGTQCHVFSDDQGYIEYYQWKFEKAHRNGHLSFGPQSGNSIRQCQRQKRWFERNTRVRLALTDFIVMASCDEFHATQGSTVQFLVEGLAQRFNPRWQKASIIGEWCNPPVPSRAFQEQATVLLNNSLVHLTDPETMEVSSKQMNVLNFLADHHLEEIYKLVHEALNNTEQKSMGTAQLVRDHLLAKSSTARSNREKFQEVDRKAGGFHWFKALLKCRLKKYAMMKHPADRAILLDDFSKQVYLEANGVEMERESSGSTSSWQKRDAAVEGAPWKRHRQEKTWL